MAKVFYIDPQSYNNLSLYDASLLHAVKGHDIAYFCNKMYQLPQFPVARVQCLFEYNRYKNGMLKGISYLLSMLRLCWAVWRERPAVVHVQWLRVWHLDWLFMRWCQWCGCRVVHTVHNVVPHVERPSDKAHYQKYYAQADALIVHNENTRQQLVRDMHIGAEKVSVIAHGAMRFPVCEEEVMQQAERFRREFSLENRPVIFSALGVQKPYKGIEEVIEAWATTPALHQSAQCHLLIAGRSHGIDYSRLAGLPNVTIIDRMLTDVEFEALLSLTTVALLSYRRISQSGLLFSCINRRVPVLVTDVGGLPEALQIAPVGWNIGPLSVSALRQQMLYLSQHRSEVEAVHRNNEAFMLLEKAYSWEQSGALTSALYTRLS